MLLREKVKNLEYIYEGDGTGKTQLYVHGIFAVAGTPNKNRRVYPYKTLRNEINRFVKENVNENRAYGTLGHDVGPSIDMQKICFKIVELKEDSEGIFPGKALVTSTPCGAIIRGLIEDGCSVGVSTRALGSLKPIPHSELSEVQNDLRLLSADAVCDPSAPGAFVQGIMEQAPWAFANGTSQETTWEMRKRLRAMSILEQQRQARKILSEYISIIARSS